MEVVAHSVIKGGRDRFMFLDVFYTANSKPKPIVVFSHGFKGFKDWGHFNVVAQQFAEAGFVFVKFNFSYNGTTLDAPENFADLNSFGENNYTTELDDLEKVIDWVLTTEKLASEIDPNSLSLMGHSRGGGIAILKACEDIRVKKVVTWAAVDDFSSISKGYDLDEWKKNGAVYVANARTKQDMPLHYQLVEDTQNNKERLDIQKLVSGLRIPFLIIHGTDDAVVPVSAGKGLHEKCDTSQLLLIEGANHTFGAVHPFTEKKLPTHAKEVVESAIKFLL